MLLALLALLAGCGRGVQAQPAEDGSATAAAVVPAAAETCKGYVALTFDDGPTPLTGQLLDTLANARVPAVFFNLGRQEQLFPGHVERQVAEGHQFGNHSWDHPDLTGLTAGQVAAQLERANAVHTPMAGQYDFFRPPFGATSPRIRSEAQRQAMVEVHWTVDSKDYEATSPAQVVQRSDDMQDGGILLMHDGKQHTVDALPQITASYRSRGMCFGRITATGEVLVSDGGVEFSARAVAAR